MTRHARPITAGAAGGLVLALAGTRLALGPLALARLAILGAALGQVALSDLRERRIPNQVVLPAIVLCAALSLAAGIHAGTGLIAGTAIVMLLLAISLASPASLGMGDVKLALLVLCALDGLATTALLITLELYALTALVLLARHGRRALGGTLPLAPLTAAGCLIALLL